MRSTLGKSKQSLNREVLSAPAGEALDSGPGPAQARVPSNSQLDQGQRPDEEEDEDEKSTEPLTVWQRIKSYFLFVKVLLSIALEDLTMLMQHNSAEHHEIVEQIQSEIRTMMAAKLKWVCTVFIQVHN